MEKTDTVSTDTTSSLSSFILESKSLPGRTQPVGIYAALNGAAVSEEAHALVALLAQLVDEHQRGTGCRKRKRGAGKLTALREGVAAFVADLLRAIALPHAQGVVYRSLKAAEYTRDTVSYRTFKAVIDAFERLGLIETHKGKQFFIASCFEPSAAPIPNGSQAARFRATDAFIEMCEQAGVYAAEVRTHFAERLPENPLILRAASRREGPFKVRGRRMSYPRTEHTRSIEAEVKRLNQFLAGFKLEPFPFAGYLRIFNEGGTENFQWNKGGRLYCQGSFNYQQAKKDDRLCITIDGEPVVEIDIRASYLTVLHGLLEESFDPSQDPYELEGIDRSAVKIWTVSTLGNGGHLKRWPRDASKEYFEEHGRKLGRVASVREIREAMVAKHPALARWGEETITWADLMFIESAAVIGAMQALMEKDIPSYPIHDSLIVRARDKGKAKEALREKYFQTVGIVPELKTKSCEVFSKTEA